LKRGRKRKFPVLALVNKNWTRKIKKLDRSKGYLFHGPLDNEPLAA
jgi:hypothetical protein